MVRRRHSRIRRARQPAVPTVSAEDLELALAKVIPHQRKLAWYDRPTFNAIWRIVEVIGFAVAVWALWYTAVGLGEARKANRIAQEESETMRKFAAWEVLKEYLPEHAVASISNLALREIERELIGIDFSCGATSRFTSCDTAPVYDGLFFPDVNLIAANFNKTTILNSDFNRSDLAGFRALLTKIENSDFRFSDLWVSDFQGATLKGTDFSSAYLAGANFENTIFDDVSFRYADLTEASFGLLDPNQIIAQADTESSVIFTGTSNTGITIETNLGSVDFLGANLSAASFCGPVGCAKGLTQEQVDRAWIWADQINHNYFEFGQHQLNLNPPPVCEFDPSENKRRRTRSFPSNCIHPHTTLQGMRPDDQN